MNSSADSNLSRRAFLSGLIGSSLAIAISAPSAEPEVSARDKKPACADLTKMLIPILKESGLPALAAGAVKQGKLVAAGAVGIRRVGAATPVTVQDKFHLGSCTKAMTATLAAMLVAQGKLHWTDTLARIFPERHNKRNAAFHNTTLEVLLTHRAGLPHDGPSYGPPEAIVTEQRLAYMDAVLATPPRFAAGSYNYSNAGYIIAGTMIERVTGKPWETFIQEKLFKPLEMNSAGFGPASNPNAADQPWGHVLENGRLVARYGDNHRALGPAGTVHCSIADYLKFAALHASMGTTPAGLLDRKSFEKLHQPVTSDYAMGWGVHQRDWAHGRALTHTGSNTMNLFLVWAAPKIDFAVAMATNAGSDKAFGFLDRIAGQLIRNYSGNA